MAEITQTQKLSSLKSHRAAIRLTLLRLQEAMASQDPKAEATRSRETPQAEAVEAEVPTDVIVPWSLTVQAPQLPSLETVAQEGQETAAVTRLTRMSPAMAARAARAPRGGPHGRPVALAAAHLRQAEMRALAARGGNGGHSHDLTAPGGDGGDAGDAGNNGAALAGCSGEWAVEVLAVAGADVIVGASGGALGYGIPIGTPGADGEPSD